MSTLAKRLKNLAGLAKREVPVVGATPHTVVHAENKWRLLRYSRQGAPRYRRPVLMVPSLINRYYVLDLGRERSLVEYLVAEGHDVFIIDWGTPGPEDRYLSFDEVCDRYIGRAVRKTSQLAGGHDVHLLGYCLGGTMSAAYAAANPAKLGSLTALAAPIDFTKAGTLAQWTRTPSFDVQELVRACGNVPWQLMQASFHMLKPTLTLGKAVTLIDRAWDDEFLDGFMVTEKWGNDNVSFPGACYETYIRELYRENRLHHGVFYLAGKSASLANIQCPLLAITFEHDHIVPSACANPLVDAVSSTDKELLELRGGHVGAVVSRKAKDRLWPQMSGFWAARDGDTAERGASDRRLGA